MKRDFKREKWMGQFEDAVYNEDAKYRGKIEWDSAIYFYNQGMGWREAATKYVETRKTS